MVLDDAGVRGGWLLDALPDGPRLMGNALLTPDGKVRPFRLSLLHQCGTDIL